MAVLTLNSTEYFHSPAVWFCPMTRSEPQQEIKVLLKPVWILAFWRLLASGWFYWEPASLLWGSKYEPERAEKIQGGYSNAQVRAGTTSQAWKGGFPDHPALAILHDARQKRATIDSSRYHSKGVAVWCSPPNYKVRRKKQSTISGGFISGVAAYKVIWTKEI